ncbi:hypothetical protein [Methylobacterium platani]|nr:hypothetical protein [Methylobacterium platani]
MTLFLSPVAVFTHTVSVELPPCLVIEPAPAIVTHNSTHGMSTPLPAGGA